MFAFTTITLVARPLLVLEHPVVRQPDALRYVRLPVENELPRLRNLKLTNLATITLNQSRKTRIAIGGALTSAPGRDQQIDKDFNMTKDKMASHMPVFRHLLPTFCQTATPGYDYQFYFAFDYNDTVFSHEQGLKDFSEVFAEFIASKCNASIQSDLHMIQCDHLKSPAWAQNDAMMEAYLDGADYLYR